MTFEEWMKEKGIEARTKTQKKTVALMKNAWNAAQKDMIRNWAKKTDNLEDIIND